MDELERLKKRADTLAREKSRYRMVTDILGELASARGLDEVVALALSTMMNAWGGTNVILYYRIDEQWYRSDVYRELEDIASIEDNEIRQVLEEGTFLELSQDDGSLLMKEMPALSYSQATWIYPLKREGDIFGALKMEGVFLNEYEDVKLGLSVIVDYLAMVLQNEILSAGRLMAANRALKDEMAKRMEDEAQYRKTIESSFDGFWVVDPRGRFLEVNDIYCRMSGYSREELFTMSIMDVEYEERPEEVKAHVKTLMEKGKDRFETRHRCKDGRVIELEINAVYTDYRGGLFYSFLRDVTEKKKMEEQYHQAQKVESIGRLAGGVAHDLNNLLSPILGYSEILSLSFSDDDKRKSQAELILDASLRARDLVRQLLAFSRKQALEYRLINPDDIIRGFEKLLRRTIRENIRFHIDLNAPSAVIRADSGQIEQVLMNLSVNAQDAMPDGGLLEIRTELKELSESRGAGDLTPGECVVLSLRDNGSGMDEEIQAHIFEPFFSTKGEQGTGLGLSTVYGIIKQHNGDIEVQSVPGEGCLFQIYLPVSQEGTYPVLRQNPGSGSSVSGELILLVEDDEQVLELAREILTQEAYQVYTAGSGEEALKLLRDGGLRIDLLLTDVIMPGMNGRDLFNCALELIPDLKAVYMSGYTDNIFSCEDERDRRTAYLQKPFTIKNLTDIVHAVLNAKE